jgi:plastocyanin
MHSKKALSILAMTLLLISLFAACGGGGEKPAAEPGSSAPEPAASTPAPARPAAVDDPAPTGSAVITGAVVFEGDVPKMKPIKMDADPGCAKKHTEEVKVEALVLGDDKQLANVFVRVTGGLPAGSYPVPAEPTVLDQEGCRYIPHVSGVMIGQTFRVLNSDGLLHNVHGLPKINSEFNRAMPAAVTETDYVFDREEVMFKIKCDVHPWMSAWVGVLPHPYYAITGTDGQFSIAGLPAGTYEIEAWHERLGTQTASVTVADGGSASTDFTFTR